MMLATGKILEKESSTGINILEPQRRKVCGDIFSEVLFHENNIMQIFSIYIEINALKFFFTIW